jgi:hypothetical protein
MRKSFLPSLFRSKLPPMQVPRLTYKVEVILKPLAPLRVVTSKLPLKVDEPNTTYTLPYVELDRNELNAKSSFPS